MDEGTTTRITTEQREDEYERLDSIFNELNQLVPIKKSSYRIVRYKEVKKENKK